MGRIYYCTDEGSKNTIVLSSAKGRACIKMELTKLVVHYYYT